METKKASHKHSETCGCGDCRKNTDETVFEITPEEKKKNGTTNKSFLNGFLAGFLALAILVIAVINVNKNILTKNSITADQAKVKAEAFINDNLMSPGTKITMKGVEEKNGIFKIVVTDGASGDVDTYMTKDGKMLFLRPLDIEKIESDKKAAGQSDTSANPNTNLVKNDKPEVEVFVMSHCPYGTQIEKGILPAVAALGNNIKFDVKFTDYAMHGDVELKEELNQYCIKTGEPAKYTNYLKCFIESAGGDSASCLTKAAVNKTKLASCVAATDKKFKITANAADRSTWKGNYPTFNIYKEDNVKYGVQGSPTLVINGATVQSGRDSASLLKTICSAFNTPPKECEAVLSAAAPAPGFGTGTSANGNGGAACGS